MSLNVVLPPTLTPYGQAYSQLVPSPSPVANVVARMEALVAPLSSSDGIACFTRLYLAVTEDVQERLAGLDFQDPRFLEPLDVAFADLFFLRPTPSSTIQLRPHERGCRSLRRGRAAASPRCSSRSRA